MNSKNRLFSVVLGTVFAVIVGSVMYKSFFSSKNGGSQGAHGDDDHGHKGGEETGPGEHGEHGESAKGPQGGRLLSEGDFAVEITIFEQGVDPQFRVYAYEDHEVLQPEKVQVVIELDRLGGIRDEFDLKPESNYLTSKKIVEEPHSFNVSVKAIFNGKEHSWSYEAFEGRTEISQEAQAASEIKSEPAGKKLLNESIQVTGKINPNEEKLQRITPRFPGIVKQLKKRLGDSVRQGEVLAVIESNSSLTQYTIQSSYEGTVLTKDVTIGSYVTEDSVLYTIADLATVWVDFSIYRKDFQKLKIGQKIEINFEDEESSPLEGKISYISMVGSESTQAFLARAELPNPKRTILPGLFVHGRIFTSTYEVPVAIKQTGLQTFREWTVAFVKVGDIFEVRPLKIGRKDETWVEIIEGMQAGQEYVSQNSYLIKADILKSGASHDH